MYIELLRSAYLFNGKIALRFTTGKSFVIELHRNRGRLIQRNFSIKVLTNGRHQYTVHLDTTRGHFEVVEARKVVERPETDREYRLNRANLARYKIEFDTIRDLIVGIKNLES